MAKKRASMIEYILMRLFYTTIIGWGVLTITFVLLRLGPSSPADKYLANIAASGSSVDVTMVQSAIDARYGLDMPLHQQYFDYIFSLLQGDLGWSFSTSMPVIELLKTHWIYSFQLVFLSTLFAVTVGTAIGLYSAVRQYTRADYASTIFSFIGISIPNFWLGIMLIMIFSVKLGMFKSYYDTSLPLFSLSNLKALVLPVITLGTGMLAGYSRYVRSVTIDNLKKDFVRTARAKGLSERTVILKHVFRNAMLPIITIIMFDLSGIVFGGAYLTEIVFGIPGLGRISFNAVFADDYAVVVAITLIGAMVTLIFNLLTDIAYTLLDPRVKYI
ncbi:MAG: ABC transporter permease [Candidatus Hydrothermarchaeaceae archaeon]